MSLIWSLLWMCVRVYVGCTICVWILQMLHILYFFYGSLPIHQVGYYSITERQMFRVISCQFGQGLVKAGKYRISITAQGGPGAMVYHIEPLVLTWPLSAACEVWPLELGAQRRNYEKVKTIQPWSYFGVILIYSNFGLVFDFWNTLCYGEPTIYSKPKCYIF